MKLLILCSFFFVAFAAYHPGRFPAISEEVVTQSMVNTINSMKPTWKAGFNRGSSIDGATRAQIKAMLGSRKGGPKLPVKKEFEVSPDALPTQFDSRVQWPYCPSIQTVRDQSACGSCYAFGAVEAMSDRICIALNMNVSLSSADAAFCCDECGGGCEGGFPSSVWQYWQDNGIVEEGCWPYPMASCDHHQNNTKNPCPGSEYPSPDCPSACDTSAGWNGPSWSEDRHHATKVYNIDGGETAIMQEIFAHGPVETAFTVYEDFVAYRSGVYKHTWGGELGGHAVKIIGWGVDSGTKYWIVANSWNVDFGEKGFFRMIRGTNNCGFEEEVNGGVPKSFP